MEPLGVYIHIPFCARKCPYCDFYSLAAEEGLMDAYTGAVCAHLSMLADMFGQRTADTVYFGGGTPSLLGERRLCRILEAVSSLFPPAPHAEITLEANPGTVSRALLSSLKESGFNRLSFGVQSGESRELAALGRIHGREDAARALEDAALCGFENCSADLMLGTPLQTETTALESVRWLAGLGVAHLSAYMLKLEENTPYYRQRDTLCLMEDDALSELYLKVCAETEKQGLFQYEISNFARPGQESRHNLKYWRLEPYLGVGPSAHSLVDSRRFYYQRNLSCFLEQARTGKPALEPERTDLAREALFLGLRTAEGVSIPALSARFGYALDLQSPFVRRLCREGLGAEENGRLRLTPAGFLVSNMILSRLLEDWRPCPQEKD